MYSVGEKDSNSKSRGKKTHTVVHGLEIVH
jgi:hypothetical protein